MQTVVKMKISKAGGNASSGSYKYMVVLPGSWVKEIGVTQEDREVFIEYKDDSILITKDCSKLNDTIKKVKVSIVKVDKNFPDKLKYRISVPPKWAKDMGITLEDREIIIDFSEHIFTVSKHKI